MLIADEAHYAQNLSAARTRAFLKLARHPRLRAAWLLTGTPMKNGRPVQLFPLLAAIGHPLSADQRAFEERYCQGHWLERLSAVVDQRLTHRLAFAFGAGVAAFGASAGVGSARPCLAW